MGLIRPATPGFLCTFVATILLAVVSFSVPLFKSIFFLEASLATEGVSGNITFGTLGYCLELSSGTTCSKATVGYELNINQLVGNHLPIQIPQVVVKWLTFALVLHIVALGLAAISAVFGLLAHIREMSMTCFSSCISGFAATVALLAFIFDLAFFFVIKSRINDVPGGSAKIGNAIWLTLVAWVLLFVSGCFYTLGRCCIKRRPRGDDWERQKPKPESAGNLGNYGNYGDRMRLDAVKAEADRKARQNQVEVGLPAFAESQPLTALVDGEAVYADDDAATAYSDMGRRPSQGGYHSGYVQGPAGTRAVDEYHTPPPNPVGSTYPPQPRRQASGHTTAASAYAPSHYAPSTQTYNDGYTSATPPPGNPYASAPPPGNAYAAASAPLHNRTAAYTTTSPPPANQYLAPAGQYMPDRYTTSPPNEYGHAAGGTSYHTATSHQQYPTNYSQIDPYDGVAPQQQYQQPVYAHQAYNNNAGLRAASPPAPSSQSFYVHDSAPAQPERHYTLGGDGYAANVQTSFNERAPAQNASQLPYPSYGLTRSPEPLNTSVPASTGNTSPVKGPRSPRSPTSPRPYQNYNDTPPGYSM